MVQELQPAGMLLHRALARKLAEAPVEEQAGGGALAEFTRRVTPVLQILMDEHGGEGSKVSLSRFFAVAAGFGSAQDLAALASCAAPAASAATAAHRKKKRRHYCGNAACESLTNLDGETNAKSKFACANCRSVCYCSSSCQMQALPAHRLYCGLIKAAKEEQGQQGAAARASAAIDTHASHQDNHD